MHKILFIIITILLTVLTSILALNWRLGQEGSQNQKIKKLSEAEIFLKERLNKHVLVLGSDIGERNIWFPGRLSEAVQYIKDIWSEQGHAPQEQVYESRGVTVKNIEIELRGKEKPEEIIIIGAHYDSVKGSPGANDNGSGVAALLELSRLHKDETQKRTIRFVAFANEEPPFFYSDEMGSRVYAARSRKNKEKIIAMLSLETIGYYSENRASQRYPFPLGLLYPDTANFIGFVGNIKSYHLVNNLLKSFKRHTAFPVQAVSAPGWLTGIGWSDHWSFWKEGYRAVMVTDTALFRYNYYHTHFDTPDKLDYAKMATVVAGLHRVIHELAN